MVQAGDSRLARVTGTGPVERALDLVTAADLVRSSDRVGVAYSGGPDSLALLILLRTHFPANLVAACHVDHGLDAASGERARAAAENAARIGVPTLSVPARVVPGATGPEAAARDARFRALGRAADLVDLDVLALGHTLDDRAETVVLALMRGTGLDGLAALPPAAPWPFPPREHRRSLSLPRIVRPLLGLCRAETRALCEAAGLDPVEDPANHDPRFLRNRVRSEIMPRLEELRPGAAARIAGTAELLADDRVALDRVADSMTGLVVDRAPGFAAFDSRRLEATQADAGSRAGSRRVVRRELTRLLGGLAPSRQACDAVMTGRAGTLAGTHLDLRDEGGIRVVSRPVTGRGVLHALPLPGVTRVEDLVVTCRGVPSPHTPDLHVRRVCDGDRRLGATSSVKDELARAGVARRVRERALVVTGDGEDGILAVLAPGAVVPSGWLDADVEWCWDSGAGDGAGAASEGSRESG
ncbi:MAG: tRNA lysidine(34) synthetase TilS [Acidimicrobiia bacterium]|nr:tRNA lysidine(34) synthetase TilS [Acidimicrobiia bacterium]